MSHTQTDRRRRVAPQQANYTTVFRTKAQRYTSTNMIVIGIAVAYLAFAVLMVAAQESTRLIFPSPLVLFLAWRYGRNKSEEVYFFIQKNAAGDFSYGYMNDEKQRKGDILIDEFTYWYTEQPSIGRSKNYTLYFMLKYDAHIVYLKEPVKLEEPPENWTLSQEDVENKTGVFQITGLRTLAKEMEKGNAPHQSFAEAGA
jgi:hypothetical protein